MTKKLHLLAYLLLAGTLIFTACNKDDDDNEDPQSSEEFVADDNTFTDFRNWVKEAELTGADPALGGAHMDDTTTVRHVYYKDGQDRVNGEYPVGTVIVKESLNETTSFQQLTAMVKRGNNFNPSGGDWEWFMLAPDGSIATGAEQEPLRGADLMNGMCVACHTAASGNDFTFSKN